MMSVHEPTGHSETCAECEGPILAMAYKGTGVCGQKCLASWRKKHPLPETLLVTREELAHAVEAAGGKAGGKGLDRVWDVLNGRV